MLPYPFISCSCSSYSLVASFCPSSVSMAAIAIAATSSTSLPLCNKLPQLSSDYHSPISIPSTHFTFKTKTTLRLKSKYPHAPRVSLLFRSLPFRVSAVFDGIDLAGDEQSTELLKLEPESEQEEEEEEEEEEEWEIDDYDDQSETQPGRRLYVGNLPYTMTSAGLAEVFGEAGRVISAQIVYDRVTDRSRGFAFVKMGSVEEAKEAIRLFNDSLVGGRTVKVNFPEVPKGGEREVMVPKIIRSQREFVDSPHKLYAGNLSWDLTSQQLKEAFADQPGLLSAKVIYDRDSGRARGFGFITFSSAEKAESALRDMNEAELEGRPMRLEKVSTPSRN